MLQSLRTPCQGLLFIEHGMCLAHAAKWESGRKEGLGKKKKSFCNRMTRRRLVVLMFKKWQQENKYISERAARK